jgi:hypothetical protein
VVAIGQARLAREHAARVKRVAADEFERRIWLPYQLCQFPAELRDAVLDEWQREVKAGRHAFAIVRLFELRAQLQRDGKCTLPGAGTRTREPLLRQLFQDRYGENRSFPMAVFRYLKICHPRWRIQKNIGWESAQVEGLAFVTAIHAIESADADLIDAFELADGRVLAIDGERVALYETFDEVVHGQPNGQRPSIPL